MSDHPIPEKPKEWLDEIRLAISDARKTKPFGILTGQRITDANLFHLAPLVCLKFRGLDNRDEELRRKVTEWPEETRRGDLLRVCRIRVR